MRFCVILSKTFVFLALWDFECFITFKKMPEMGEQQQMGVLFLSHTLVLPYRKYEDQSHW